MLQPARASPTVVLNHLSTVAMGISWPEQLVALSAPGDLSERGDCPEALIPLAGLADGCPGVLSALTYGYDFTRSVYHDGQAFPQAVRTSERKDFGQLKGPAQNLVARYARDASTPPLQIQMAQMLQVFVDTTAAGELLHGPILAAVPN